MRAAADPSLLLESRRPLGTLVRGVGFLAGLGLWFMVQGSGSRGAGIQDPEALTDQRGCKAFGARSSKVA